MKNKLSRKNIVAAAVIVFCAAVAVWGAAARADEGQDRSNPMSGLVAAIASKFNLSEDAVQAVFDEQMQVRREKMEANRKEMEAKRQEQLDGRLDKLVSEGKLTEAQASMIKDKRTELEAQTAAPAGAGSDFKNMTAEERKAAMEEQKTKMEARREALKQWARDNGIPEEYLPMAGAGFAGGGHGRGGEFGRPGFDGQGPCFDDGLEP